MPFRRKKKVNFGVYLILNNNEWNIPINITNHLEETHFSLRVYIPYFLLLHIFCILYNTDTYIHIHTHSYRFSDNETINKKISKKIVIESSFVTKTIFEFIK